jgi:Na+/H+-translocating membrane pyrophosphatase
MDMDISIVVPLGGIIALLFAIYLFYNVKKQSPGNKKMQVVYIIIY